MEMKNIINLRHGRLVGVLALVVTLVGCGGGEDGSAATAMTSDATPAVVSTATPQTSVTTSSGAGTSQPPSEVITPVAIAPVSDPAPMISGSAATSIKVGQAYSFQPSATDTDNAALTFAVTGAPKWATFSTTTGRLSGTPTSADVGVNQSIIVQVSNTNATTALAAFSITVVAAGSSTGSATLSWTPPTQNTDGSALADLSGYVIHYGTASMTYTSSVTVANPGLTTYVVEDLPAGTYYFSMTSTASDGATSSASAEASMTIS
jgi:Putative Ig domain